MRVGMAADHGGFALKTLLAQTLRAAGHEIIDYGAQALDPDDDYPDFVIPLGRAVVAGTVERGIALCGSGVGASIAANKIAGVRAGLIHDVFSAHQGVEDDDMNVFCLGGNVIGEALAAELIEKFLAARFSGAARHRRRVAKVALLEPWAAGSASAHPHVLACGFPLTVEAIAGGRVAAFTLDWYTRRWTSSDEHDIADYPFIAEVDGKRYEIYGDGKFDEEEVAAQPDRIAGV